MPVRVTCPPMDVVMPPPPPPVKSRQPGVSRSLLYNGSRFKGHQKSKGNQYDVEVILQVGVLSLFPNVRNNLTLLLIIAAVAR